MFERPDAGEKTVFVQSYFKRATEHTDRQEGIELTLSAGADIVAQLTTSRSQPDPKYFIGGGKIEELAAIVKDTQAELVVVNHNISPAQERNIERAIECRVLDRTGLILDIFAKRARTFEGKLQVELAQLKYMSTRLVRGWTHLERQRGGGIGMTGPGETQLELDKRLIGERIKQIQQKLDKVRQTRELGRKSRQSSHVLTVALVGYTNAGKSTLFNQLTDAGIYQADQLFATLDPTIRKVLIPGLGQVVFVDTVGFIRHLPHDLVESFRATLEETIEADLLLHVVDAHHTDKDEFIEQVNLVLDQINVQDKPQLMVMNKIDLLSEQRARIDYNNQGAPKRVWVSSKTQQGLDLLRHALAECLSSNIFRGTLTLSPDMGDLRAALYRDQAILAEHFNQNGDSVLTVSIDYDELNRLGLKMGYDIQQLIEGHQKEH